MNSLRISFLAACLSCFALGSAFSQIPAANRLDSAQLLSTSDPEIAFVLATEALEESKLAKDDPLTGKIQLLRGSILFQFGMFQQSAEALYEAGHIFQTSQNQSQLAKVHNLLGEVYYKIKSPTEALQRHETALEIYQKLKDPAGEAETKSFIGGMYEKIGAYPKALEYQNEALGIFEKLGLKSSIAFVRENIGSIYEDLGNYDSAYSNFQKALILNTELGDSLHMISNLNNLGDVYRKTKEPEKSLAYSLQAAEMSERLGSLYQQRSAVVDISKANAEIGNFEQAYYFLEQSRKLSESVFSEESTRQLAVQEAQYKLFAKNQEIDRLEQKQRFDGKIKWLLLLLLGILCVLGWVIFNRQTLKIRSNKELLERQQEILKVKEQLIETEKQNLHLLELKMKAEDEAHSKSLTAQTLHVIDKNQMLDDIQSRLKSILEDEPKEQKKKIRNLIKQIDYNFSHDSDWDDFKHNFERVHQDFFKNIQQSSDGLTPAELKLVSLMRLNLSSKEIASSLGISMDSLRISRYRLRKKLKLEKGGSLQQFILCI